MPLPSGHHSLGRGGDLRGAFHTFPDFVDFAAFLTRVREAGGAPGTLPIRRSSKRNKFSDAERCYVKIRVSAGRALTGSRRGPDHRAAAASDFRRYPRIPPSLKAWSPEAHVAQQPTLTIPGGTSAPSLVRGRQRTSRRRQPDPRSSHHAES